MFTAIHHFHRDHSAHCLRAVPTKILHNRCFQFLLGIIFVPREIEDNGYAKYFWGVNKVHFGLGKMVNVYQWKCYYCDGESF